MCGAPAAAGKQVDVIRESITGCEMAWRAAAGLRHSRGPVCELTPSSNRTPQPQTEKIAVARDSDLVYLFSKNPLEQAGVSP